VGQLAICTNGPQYYAERIIQVNNLARFFDQIRYWQSEEDTKTSMVRELLAKLDARPAILIGDRRHDFEAAHKNGLIAVAATYGYGKQDELREADAAAASPAELPDLVEELIRRKPDPRNA
jgi:phosphoglycolate phosphatase